MKTLLFLTVLVLVSGVYGAPSALAPAPLDHGEGAGYLWWDSNESSTWAPSTNWRTPSNSLGFRADNDYTTYPIPFNIRFCMGNFSAGSNIYISSNGFVSFSSTGAHDPINQNIPNPNAPNLLVAALWDNLHGYSNGEVSADVFGSAPNREFVITWSPWYYNGSSVDPIEFQIIFYETNVSNMNNTVEIQYKDVFGDSWRDRGSSATVGIENVNGQSAAKYSYNQAILDNGLAIRFVDKTFVNSQLDPFDLLTPAHNSHHEVGDTINFSWEPSGYSGAGSVTYELFLSSNPQFTDPLVFDVGTSTSMNYVFGTGQHGTYYWRVRATESILQLHRYSDSTNIFYIQQQGSISKTTWGAIKANP